jgi:plastocyanin
MQRHRRLAAAAFLSLAMAVPAQGGEIAAEIRTFQFRPSAIAVKAGDKVTWTNYDAIEHSITAETPAGDEPLFDTGFFRQVETRSLVFNSPGEYRFRCDRHKSMTGVITVE